MVEHIDDLIQREVNVAVFDVDNTITKSNVLDLYLYIKFQKTKVKMFYYTWFIFFAITHVPIYLVLDFFSRELFQRVFYRKYKKYSVKDINEYSVQLFNKKLKYKFIKDIHDLIFYLKSKGVKVILLSTSISPLIKQYAKYFDVEYKSLEIKDKNDKAEVDTTSLENFKFNFIKNYNPQFTISVADSKHDLPVLEYTKYSIVVANKKSNWFKNLKEPVVLRI